ncbi:MAG: hypothetical protein CMJ78_13805 [Planctomycetaceae bacterium]|nr:hypothetical protein [Planctomycetaceae bacterium]
MSDHGRLAGMDTDVWTQDQIDAGIRIHGMHNLPYGVIRIPNIETEVCIIDVASGNVAMTVPLELRAMNGRLSGEDVYSFEFTTLTTPGIYKAYLPGVGISDEFEINDDVYQAAAVTAARTFYHQRSGMALEAPFADFRFTRPENHWFTGGPNNSVVGGWYHSSIADSALYSGEAVFQADVEAAAPVLNRDPGTALDLTGGWCDAGDYGRYTPTAAAAVWQLLTAYELAPTRFPDNLWNIPESGNGISDLLDEVRYETDWLIKMQDPTDGGVYHKLTRSGFDVGLPHEDPRAQFLFEKTTHGTAIFAATMALSSRVFEPIDANLAATYLQRAELAWQFLENHPSETPEGGFFNPSYPLTGEYNDDNDYDNRLWAAAELYRTTGQSAYRTFFEDWYNDPETDPPDQQGQPDWKHHYMKAYWAYQATTHPTDAALQQELRDEFFIRSADEQLIPRLENNTYHESARSDVPIFFGYGSHSRSLTYAFPLLQAFYLTGDQQYFDAAAVNANTQFGANPLSMSFVTGIGDRYPMRPLHTPSISDDVSEPFPGLPVFGVTTHMSNGHWTGRYTSARQPTRRTLHGLRQRLGWLS